MFSQKYDFRINISRIDIFGPFMLNSTVELGAQRVSEQSNEKLFLGRSTVDIVSNIHNTTDASIVFESTNKAKIFIGSDILEVYITSSKHTDTYLVDAVSSPIDNTGSSKQADYFGSTNVQFIISDSKVAHRSRASISTAAVKRSYAKMIPEGHAAIKDLPISSLVESNLKAADSRHASKLLQSKTAQNFSKSDQSTISRVKQPDPTTISRVKQPDPMHNTNKIARRIQMTNPCIKVISMPKDAFARNVTAFFSPLKIAEIYVSLDSGATTVDQSDSNYCTAYIEFDDISSAEIGLLRNGEPIMCTSSNTDASLSKSKSSYFLELTNIGNAEYLWVKALGLTCYATNVPIRSLFKALNDLHPHRVFIPFIESYLNNWNDCVEVYSADPKLPQAVPRKMQNTFYLMESPASSRIIGEEFLQRGMWERLKCDVKQNDAINVSTSCSLNRRRSDVQNVIDDLELLLPDLLLRNYQENLNEYVIGTSSIQEKGSSMQSLNTICTSQLCRYLAAYKRLRTALWSEQIATTASV